MTLNGTLPIDLHKELELYFIFHFRLFIVKTSHKICKKNCKILLWAIAQPFK